MGYAPFKVLISVGESGPNCLMHRVLGPHKFTLKWRLDRFGRFVWFTLWLHLISYLLKPLQILSASHTESTEQSLWCPKHTELNGNKEGTLSLVDFYSVPKRIPDIFRYNSSKNCLIFIIFGKFISKRICNQTIVYFSTSPKQCLCTVKQKNKNRVFSL